jgi:hypothetical protein
MWYGWRLSGNDHRTHHKMSRFVNFQVSLVHPRELGHTLRADSVSMMTAREARFGAMDIGIPQTDKPMK